MRASRNLNLRPVGRAPLIAKNARSVDNGRGSTTLMATILVSACNEMTLLVAWAAEEGYRVIEAYDSGETVQQVLAGHPNVVIVPDHAEPVEGVDLLTVIRRLTSSAIVVVGEGEANTMAKALFEGADDYMKSPSDGLDFKRRLRFLLRRSSERRTTNGVPKLT